MAGGVDAVINIGGRSGSKCDMIASVLLEIFIGCVMDGHFIVSFSGDLRCPNPCIP